MSTKRCAVRLKIMSHLLTASQAFDAMIKEICNALMESDVNVKLVAGLRASIRKSVNFKDIGPGVNKKRLIQKVPGNSPRPGLRPVLTEPCRPSSMNSSSL